jgi:hypothetical protein
MGGPRPGSVMRRPPAPQWYAVRAVDRLERALPSPKPPPNPAVTGAATTSCPDHPGGS